MNGIAFEWDRQKDLSNRKKHGVGFAEASTVFRDPLSITIEDAAAEEERLVIVGASFEQRLLVVVHTIREERIRLINARLATKHEKRSYEEGSSETTN